MTERSHNDEKLEVVALMPGSPEFADSVANDAFGFPVRNKCPKGHEMRAELCRAGPFYICEHCRVKFYWGDHNQKNYKIIADHLDDILSDVLDGNQDLKHRYRAFKSYWKE